MAGAPAIELRHIRKRFPAQSKSRDEVTALDDVNLRVDTGEFYCLLGPSGCGKTTVLNMIAGFEHASEGSVRLDGAEIRGPGPDRVVVFQQPNLLPWLSVRDNVGFGPRLRTRRGDHNRKADELLAATGLEGFASHYPYELSGGMQQRVALCRSLVMEPKVLLMDEPFGALDAQTRVSMQELLLRIATEVKPTVLFITHDVEEALFLGDRVGVMRARPGCLVSEYDVDLPRPRSYDATTDSTFIDLKRKVLADIRSDDADAGATRRDG